jgi:RNA polymerase sigma-70 factor (ECF subfamily)
LKYTNDHKIEFTIVFNRLKRRLYNYLLKMTSDRLTAEDISQNVFLKLFENFDKIEDKSKTDIWVFKTAKFEVFNFYRGKSVKVDQFGVEDSDEIEISSDLDVLEAIELKDFKEKLEDEINILPFEQREVFVLKEFGGLSYEQISEILDINENLVRSRLHSARRKLIAKLSKAVK